MKRITVVGAVIWRDGLILSAQRGPEMSLSGMWEFPGGKIEPGETQAETLRREIQEELLCEIEVGEQITRAEYEYSFGLVDMTTFHCRLVRGEPVATEHSELRWVPVAELRELKWAPVDVPTIDALMIQETS